MFLIKSKEEKKVQEGFKTKDIKDSQKTCFLFNNKDENLELAKIFILKEVLKNKNIQFSTITYTEDNIELIQNYKDAHNHISDIENQKIIQRLNNINIEFLMDTFKKKFTFYIVINNNDINKVKKELNNLSFIESDFETIFQHFIPINSKIKNGKTSLEIKAKNSKFLKILKADNLTLDISLEEISKIKDVTSKLYIKTDYVGETQKTYIWLRNKSIKKLEEDYIKIKEYFLNKKNQIEEEINSKDIYYSVPINFTKKIKTFENIFIPENLFLNNEKKANLIFKDELERYNPYNFFEERNSNFYINGPTGSGKTFLRKFITFNYLLDNKQIRTITINEKDTSFEKIVGGEHLIFNEFYSFNLFNKQELSERKITDITHIILSLIDNMHKDDILKRYIEDAIKDVYKIFEKKSTLKLVYELLLKNKEIKNDIKKLYDYANENGKFFHLFHCEEEFILDNDYILFDLSRIENKAILKAVFIQITSIINDNFQKTGKDKILILEADLLSSDNNIREYTKNLLIFNRRNNISTGIITQEKINEIEDLCETNFILQNNKKFYLKKNKDTKVLFEIPINKTMQLIFEDNPLILEQFKKEANKTGKDEINIRIEKALQLASKEKDLFS